MARAAAIAAPSRHWLRHVRQVPSGTPGAFQDALLGAWWLAEHDGLTFVQAQDTPTLGDEGQLDLTVPSVDLAGRSAGDRFYFLAGSADVSPGAPAGAVAPYHPGDEFFELYQDRDRLIMVGTPYDAQPTVGQVLLNTGDAFRLLRKARETTAGWWCNSPRDAFEHYTRLWKAVISENWAGAPSRLPFSPSGAGVTADGLWEYVNATSAGGDQHVVFEGSSSTAGGQIISTVPVFDGGWGDHSCWRAETTFSTVWAPSGSVPLLQLQLMSTSGQEIAALGVTPDGGIGITTSDLSGSPGSWPVDTSTLFGSAAVGAFAAPYNLVIEARDRFLYFYVDGQFVGNAVRPDLDGGTDLFVQIAATGMGAGDYVYADYVIVRETTSPLNGGDPGDYVLPSPPVPGGLTGEYFDLASFQAQFGFGGPGPGGSVPLFSAPIVNAFKLGERQDLSLAFGSGTSQPSWQMPCTAQFGVRWSGAIYLPLDAQDVHFALPTTGAHGTLDQMRLWVGQTRAGEQILTNWQTDTPVSSSVGMRSLFGEVPGWYSLVFEWVFLGAGTGVAYTTNPEVTWDVGGAGTTIPSTRLAPLGCFRQQVKNDSHYDTLQTTLAQAFAYQFTCEPRKLESGFFPGAIIPRGRVGRDTDLILDDSLGIDPQPQLVGEDVADAVLADAQGLGGNSAGGLSLEAFNFEGLLQHPFVSAELESLPSTSVASQLLLTLLTLVGFREAIWEQFQSSVSPIRQKQDTFPLSGDLAEFDWKPGDGLRVRLPSVFIVDEIPRQLFTVQRTRTPDGVSDAQATTQPRIRSPQTTLRKFIRQVYGQARTFQGQLVQSESAHVDAPDVAAVSLPTNTSLVRKAELVVVASDGYAGTIEINGASTGIPVTVPGSYMITQQTAKNNDIEPRMLVNLTAPSPGTSVTYCVRLTVLIPSF